MRATIQAEIITEEQVLNSKNALINRQFLMQPIQKDGQNLGIVSVLICPQDET